MLSLFRQNQSALALLLAGYVLALRLPALLGWIDLEAPVSDGGGVLYTLLPEWLRTPGLWSAWVSALLVWAQAVAVNQVADRNRLLNDRSWLPGVFYVLAASCTADLQYLSPALVAASLTPVLFQLLTLLYNKKEVSGRMFDLGFWPAVGSLLYPSYFWLVLAVILSVPVWRSFSLRERILLTLGVMVAFFLAFTAFFWFDKGGWFWDIQLAGWRSGWGFSFPRESGHFTSKMLLVALLLFALLSIPAYYRKKLIQVQKLISTLLWFFLWAILTFVANPAWVGAHWALAVFSIGNFLAVRMQDFRNFALVELVHALLVMLLYASLFFPYIQMLVT
ncbi:MAG: hypothetical protein SFV52_07490 [Saprospiraceae bacterium]|nr:hypothetical protein [Saprospiraceae bacterium]